MGYAKTIWGRCRGSEQTVYGVHIRWGVWFLIRYGLIAFDLANNRKWYY